MKMKKRLSRAEKEEYMRLVVSIFEEKRETMTYEEYEKLATAYAWSHSIDVDEYTCVGTIPNFLIKIHWRTCSDAVEDLECKLNRLKTMYDEVENLSKVHTDINIGETLSICKDLISDISKQIGPVKAEIYKLACMVPKDKEDLKGNIWEFLFHQGINELIERARYLLATAKESIHPGTVDPLKLQTMLTYEEYEAIVKPHLRENYNIEDMYNMYRRRWIDYIVGMYNLECELNRLKPMICEAINLSKEVYSKGISMNFCFKGVNIGETLSLCILWADNIQREINAAKLDFLIDAGRIKYDHWYRKEIAKHNVFYCDNLAHKRYLLDTVMTALRQAKNGKM